MIIRGDECKTVCAKPCAQHFSRVQRLASRVQKGVAILLSGVIVKVLLHRSSRREASASGKTGANHRSTLTYPRR